MSSATANLLTQVIDDTLNWFVVWHRLSFASPEIRAKAARLLDAPASFNQWRAAAAALPQEQPAIEKIIALHEQLHTLTRMVLLKDSSSTAIGANDDDGVTAKYLELMQGLRRLERAFGAAASELDPLTGLQTRAGLHRDLTREIKRFERSQRPFCVAIMDIDHFKKVNDSYGHDAGDKVLAAVADRIAKTLRAHDDAYRLGGEEFLLCLKEADLDAGLQVLERLRLALEQTPVAIEGIALPVTASFGLTAGTAIATPEELLKQADEALYRAKNTGRNRVVIAR